MGTEVTRAGDADRQRYYDRLDQLFDSGHIASAQELTSMREEVLNARSIRSLNMVLDGMPPQPLPPQRRDMGIPRNYIPPCAAGGFLGLLIAVLPSATLTGMHGLLVNFVTTATLITGIVIFVASIATLITASICWEENENDKKGRRLRDSNR